MVNKSVLAIGIDPAFADVSRLGRLSPDLVRSYIAAQLKLLRKRGYDVESYLLAPGAAAEQVITGALAARKFDCVLIGAGLRADPSQFLLFEKIINLVHALAPGASICFNTRPGDSVEAVRRWVCPARGSGDAAACDGDPPDTDGLWRTAAGIGRDLCEANPTTI